MKCLWAAGLAAACVLAMAGAAHAATALASPPPAPLELIPLSFAAGGDVLYLERRSLNPEMAVRGPVDVWTFYALGEPTTRDGVAVSGLWSQDRIDCAVGVAKATIVHYVDGKGRMVKSATNAVKPAPVAAADPYARIFAMACKGARYAVDPVDNVVLPMTKAQRPFRIKAASVPQSTPDAPLDWVLGPHSGEQATAYAADVAVKPPRLHVMFRFLTRQNITGSPEPAYGFLATLEYDCKAGKARTVATTWFDLMKKPSDGNHNVLAWEPFAAKPAAAPALTSLCFPGKLPTGEVYEGSADDAQGWMDKVIAATGRSEAALAAKTPAAAPAEKPKSPAQTKVEMPANPQAQPKSAPVSWAYGALSDDQNFAYAPFGLSPVPDKAGMMMMFRYRKPQAIAGQGEPVFGTMRVFSIKCAASQVQLDSEYYFGADGRYSGEATVSGQWLPATRYDLVEHLLDIYCTHGELPAGDQRFEAADTQAAQKWLAGHLKAP